MAFDPGKLTTEQLRLLNVVAPGLKALQEQLQKALAAGDPTADQLQVVVLEQAERAARTLGYVP